MPSLSRLGYSRTDTPNSDYSQTGRYFRKGAFAVCMAQSFLARSLDMHLPASPQILVGQSKIIEKYRGGQGVQASDWV